MNKQVVKVKLDLVFFLFDILVHLLLRLLMSSSKFRTSSLIQKMFAWLRTFQRHRSQLLIRSCWFVVRFFLGTRSSGFAGKEVALILLFDYGNENIVSFLPLSTDILWHKYLIGRDVSKKIKERFIVCSVPTWYYTSYSAYLHVRRITIQDARVTIGIFRVVLVFTFTRTE